MFGPILKEHLEMRISIIAAVMSIVSAAPVLGSGNAGIPAGGAICKACVLNSASLQMLPSNNYVGPCPFQLTSRTLVKAASGSTYVNDEIDLSSPGGPIIQFNESDHTGRHLPIGPEGWGSIDWRLSFSPKFFQDGQNRLMHAKVTGELRSPGGSTQILTAEADFRWTCTLNRLTVPALPELHPSPGR